VDGMRKWLDRVYRLYKENNIKFVSKLEEKSKSLNIAFHKFIKRVSTLIEERSFNVAISQMMIYINECYNYKTLNTEHAQSFLIVLSCFAPHLAEEL
jgi:leucyl-tRNA synthetase